MTRPFASHADEIAAAREAEHRNALWIKPDMGQITDMWVPINEPPRWTWREWLAAAVVVCALAWAAAVGLAPAIAAEAVGAALGDVSGCLERGGCE